MSIAASPLRGLEVFLDHPAELVRQVRQLSGVLSKWGARITEHIPSEGVVIVLRGSGSRPRVTAPLPYARNQLLARILAKQLNVDCGRRLGWGSSSTTVHMYGYSDDMAHLVAGGLLLWRAVEKGSHNEVATMISAVEDLDQTRVVTIESEEHPSESAMAHSRPETTFPPMTSATADEVEQGPAQAAAMSTEQATPIEDSVQTHADSWVPSSDKSEIGGHESSLAPAEENDEGQPDSSLERRGGRAGHGSYRDTNRIPYLPYLSYGHHVRKSPQTTAPDRRQSSPHIHESMPVGFTGKSDSPAPDRTTEPVVPTPPQNAPRAYPPKHRSIVRTRDLKPAKPREQIGPRRGG